MRALVYYGRADVRYEDFPEPAQLGSREVRLRVNWAGICHTDFNEYQNGPIIIKKEPNPRSGRSMPVVLGHEVSGTVVAGGGEEFGGRGVGGGRGVERRGVGPRVVVNAIDSCRACDFCRRGKYSLCRS